ncbi:MAG: hypothetical protein WBL50_20305 [Candidatus Acidiferrum sp.]
MASLPFVIERGIIAGFGLTEGKAVLSGRIDEVAKAIGNKIRDA